MLNLRYYRKGKKQRISCANCAVDLENMQALVRMEAGVEVGRGASLCSLDRKLSVELWPEQNQRQCSCGA